MVGREIGGGSFTYPSGTVTAIAALSTALFLVSPRLARPFVALAGVAAVTGTGLAVLVLRWHYPTDVAGGVWVGGGAVFSIDAFAHLPWLFTSRRLEAEPAAAPRGAAPPLRV
jgi:membrane-associated phospholipid phosphatase